MRGVGEVGVARPDQGGVEGGHGAAQVGDGLGVGEVVAGTATGTAAGGENHLVTQVLFRVPRPKQNILLRKLRAVGIWTFFCGAFPISDC